MKILLLDAIEEHMGHKPPLGLMYIASYLRKNSNHEVFLLDSQAQDLSIHQILEQVDQIRPDVVGITAWTDYWYDITQLVAGIKNRNSRIHISLGGPHVSVFPQLALEYPGVDSIILGDGESPFLALVDALSMGNALQGIRGLFVKGDVANAENESFHWHENLDELPFPDRSAQPLRNYTSVFGKKRLATTMVTSRGCPFQCIFCKLHFQRTRLRSAGNVVKEFEEVRSLGIREIELYDDTFSVSRQRVLDICQEIDRRKLDVDWMCRDRVDNVDEETLAWMKRAGCSRIHLGVESGSDKTLKTVKKGITTSQIRTAVGAAKRAGLEVLTYFMLGLPGETARDIEETIEFAIELDPDYATFSITIPYPGTELYNRGLEEGIIPKDYWRDYVESPIPDFRLEHLYEEHLTKEELIRARNRAIKRFYFRPRYIRGNLTKVTSLRALSRRARMALSLFKETGR